MSHKRHAFKSVDCSLSVVRFLLIVSCCLFSTAMAQELTMITLINGAALEGEVLELSESGLTLKVGRSTKTYPWYALSAGTRFQYDQSYRMNLEGYLAGKDSSSLTNAPDPHYDPMNPDAGVEAAVDTAVSAAGPLNFTVYKTPDLIEPKKVPALSVISLDEYEFNAFQYGPNTRDILLTGFSSGNPPSMLIINMNELGLVKEDPTDRTISGTDYFACPRHVFSANVGDVAVEQRVEWLVKKENTSKRYVHAEVDLTRGSTRSSFVLTGDPGSFEKSEQTLTPKSILVEPALSFTITIEDEKTYLVGKVRMGRLSLMPRSGMDLSMQVKISDSSGQTVLSEKPSFNADTVPGDYPVKVDISRCAAGQQYKIEAFISLGALLGDISHEEIFVMPDALKL